MRRLKPTPEEYRALAEQSGLLARTPTIHLATGMLVHGVPRLWCGAPVQQDSEGCWLAAQSRVNATCAACLDALVAAEALPKLEVTPEALERIVELIEDPPVPSERLVNAMREERTRRASDRPGPQDVTAEFMAPRERRKKSGKVSAARALELFERAKRIGMSTDEEDRFETPADLVALYGWLHRDVYGAAPSELHDQVWMHAAVAAKRMVQREFKGSVDDAVDFIRWVWRREKDREVWRRRNPERAGKRIGWALQFSHGALLTDYRVAQTRGVG